jgi:hypothetical protein
VENLASAELTMQVRGGTVNRAHRFINLRNDGFAGNHALDEPKARENGVTFCMPAFFPACHQIQVSAETEVMLKL